MIVDARGFFLLFLYLYSCKENSSYFFQLSEILEHVGTLLDVDTNNKGIIQVSLALAQPILKGSQTLTAQLPGSLQMALRDLGHTVSIYSV